MDLSVREVSSQDHVSSNSSEDSDISLDEAILNSISYSKKQFEQDENA